MCMSTSTILDDIKQPIAESDAAKWSYISLLFSFFYFFPLFVAFNTYSISKVAVTIAMYAVFIGLFMLTVRNVGKNTVVPIGAIIALASLGAGIHSGTNVLFGYAAFFSGYYFRTKASNYFLIANLACQLLSVYLYDLVFAYYIGPALALTISLHIYGRFSRKETQNYLRQQQQNQQIESLAAIAERERIARDMHDLLGHSLSSLALKSELAQKLIDKGEVAKASDEIDQVAQLARITLSEVREAVTGLKQKSLSAGIEKLIEQLKSLGFETELLFELDSTSAELESVLLILSKEWVTNILRHSNGDSVLIKLTKLANSLVLEIKDNGLANKISEGNGITGMRARVAEFDGKFSLDTTEGVKLTITLPCENS